MFSNSLLNKWILGFLLIQFLQACASSRWYSVTQEPAVPYAYVHDGVFVSGNYVRSALITEIDGNTVENSTSNELKISIGLHQVKIYCDEAKGSYDSSELSGQARVLEFEAHTERRYKAFCMPFTHWWIEDLENKQIVVGQKPANYKK